MTEEIQDQGQIQDQVFFIITLVTSDLQYYRIQFHKKAFSLMKLLISPEILYKICSPLFFITTKARVTRELSYLVHYLH